MSENFFGRRIGLESKGRKGREFSDPGIPGTGPRYAIFVMVWVHSGPRFLTSPVLVRPDWSQFGFNPKLHSEKLF